MINNDRIVPIQKTDFLTMIGTICNLISTIADVDTAITTLKAKDTIGNFEITETPESGIMLLADQPLKSLDFADGVSNAVVFFVPAYDYKGFTINGAAVTPAEGSATVIPDGITLYGASLGDGAIGFFAMSPIANSAEESGGGEEH